MENLINQNSKSNSDFKFEPQFERRLIKNYTGYFKEYLKNLEGIFKKGG